MVNTIDADTLKKKMDNKEDFHLIEALLPEEYEKWHLPGAINIHFKKIGQKSGELFQKDDEIIVYCHNPECNASTLAAKKLDDLGYSNVVEFEGGKDAWLAAGYPTEN